MISILLSFVTAFFESLKDVVSKKSLRNMNEYVVSWSLRYFALIIILPFVFYEGIPVIGDNFLIAFLVSGFNVALTTVLYMKALKYSDLSVSVPMLTFSSLFLLFTSPLILGEFPTYQGLFGVLLIVFGAYWVNVQTNNASFFAPFKYLLKEKGPKFMLLVAFIWSVNANIDKIGIQNSSPIFWVFSMNTFAFIFLLPFMLYQSKNCAECIKTNWKILFSIGFFVAFSFLAQATAVKLTLVAYVIAIKRASILISVLLGYFVFNEKIRNRLPGTILMFSGLLLIIFS
ncbi:hypothetical protein COV11_03025 [Candidatus Woesearchaeota archaeon CG10_big_fil_rev_8_21_14_0_10_30_7]|nr:MAG: hypothetical protein COV11_03025 [Candidatus Woesearchaeota archaeon CG10_big_fil_rev_8_21_14_0_10_30_7]